MTVLPRGGTVRTASARHPYGETGLPSGGPGSAGPARPRSAGVARRGATDRRRPACTDPVLEHP